MEMVDNIETAQVNWIKHDQGLEITVVLPVPMYPFWDRLFVIEPPCDKA